MITKPTIIVQKHPTIDPKNQCNSKAAMIIVPKIPSIPKIISIAAKIIKIFLNIVKQFFQKLHPTKKALYQHRVFQIFVC